MNGYEAIVRVEAAPGWGSQGTLGHRGLYLYADSVRFDFGAQERKRESKLTGAREVSGSSYSVDNFYPTAEITWQPRVDDILPFLMANFQAGTMFSGGTFEFVRIGKDLDWTTGGSHVGTNAYSINLDVFYGNTLIGGGTGANGFRGFNGIVDKLTLSAKYGEDVQAVANIKFKTATRFNFPSGFSTTPNGIGSFSAFNQMVDWQGTLTVTGESYDIDDFELSFSNNSADRSRIGQRGYNRFPFASPFMAEGKIGMEFDRDLDKLAEGTGNSGTFEFRQSASAWLSCIFNNFVYSPANPDLSGGNQVIDISLPFRGYPTVNGGTSCVIRVCTGSSYGTAMFGFYSING